MSSLRRLSLLTGSALVVLAMTAATALADIEDSTNPGVPYTGNVYAEHNANTGADPTLTAGSVVISCDGATSQSQGGIDGDWDALGGPANAVLDFAWTGCSATGGLNTCTVDDVIGVPVNFAEFATVPDPNPDGYVAAPDGNIVNTGRGATFIDCTGGVFSCDAWSDPADGTAVEANVEFDDQIVSINDTVGVGGSLACPSSGQWEARYQIVVRSGVDDPHGPLLSTGTE